MYWVGSSNLKKKKRKRKKRKKKKKRKKEEEEEEKECRLWAVLFCTALVFGIRPREFSYFHKLVSH